jgi:hypothetical protein
MSSYDTHTQCARVHTGGQVCLLSQMLYAVYGVVTMHHFSQAEASHDHLFLAKASEVRPIAVSRVAVVQRVVKELGRCFCDVTGNGLTSLMR